MKHFWDTEIGSCIHWSKVKELVPQKEFDKLFQQFKSKSKKKQNNTLPMPKLIDTLTQLIDVYSGQIPTEEIIGAFEVCKTQVLNNTIGNKVPF